MLPTLGIKGERNVATVDDRCRGRGPIFDICFRRSYRKAVILRAHDGVSISGLAYTADHPKAIVLLFHQADSSKAEYATIAPRLVAAGFSALAIDQRSGGSLYGPNDTVRRLGKPASYEQAKPDLEAAAHDSPLIASAATYQVMTDSGPTADTSERLAEVSV